MAILCTSFGQRSNGEDNSPIVIEVCDPKGSMNRQSVVVFDSKTHFSDPNKSSAHLWLVYCSFQDTIYGTLVTLANAVFSTSALRVHWHKLKSKFFSDNCTQLLCR
jgi:hypothetical protein